MDGTIFADEHTTHAVHIEIRTLWCTDQDVVLIGNDNSAGFFVDKRGKEGRQVVGIEHGCRVGECAWKIGRPHDDDAVVSCDDFTLNGVFAVSTNICVHVDHNGTRFEVSNSGRGNGDGCWTTENTSGCNDDVCVGSNPTDGVVDFLNEFGCEWFCVAGFVFKIIHAINFNETTTDGFNLFSR